MRDPLRWLLAALSVAFGASLFWGIQEHRELLRVRRGAESDRQAFLDLESRLNAAERARVAAEAGLRGQAGTNPRRMFSPGQAVPDPATLDKFNAAVDADPIWAAFYRRLERRRILSRYGILLDALGLEPQKRASVGDLLVQRAITSRALVHELRNAGRKYNSPEFIGTVGKATDPIDARIEALVGGPDARELKEWNSAIYSYGNAPDGPVAQDAVSLKEAGYDLTTGQLVRLALIRYEVFASNADSRNPAAAESVDPKTGLTPMEEALFSRDAEVLSPQEIAVLRDWAMEEHRARAAVAALRATFHLEPVRPPP